MMLEKKAFKAFLTELSILFISFCSIYSIILLILLNQFIYNNFIIFQQNKFFIFNGIIENERL